MYIGVHKPSSKGGGNKGSSSDVMQYLSKEDKKGMDYITDEKLEEIKNFFDKENNQLNVFEATEIIDNHSKGLKKDESKFFMLTINPSEKELQAIKVVSEKEAEKNNGNSNEIFKEKLMDYTKIVMNEYAKNFHREINGIPLSVDNINYVARIETERTYKYNDESVIHNREVSKNKEGEFIRNQDGKIIKEGMKKDGNNAHVHVIVSRYDMDKKMTLSPHAIAKTSNDNHIVNGNNVTIGFNHVDFKINCEKQFDKQFDYDRSKDISTEKSINNAKDKSNFDLKDVVSKGSSVIGQDGKVDTFQIASNTTKIITDLLTNPTKLITDVTEMVKDQVKTIALPEIESNPIKEAQQKIDLKQQAKQKAKETITSGGLEMD